ncbi:hypothetical protein ACQ4PT_055167 [Festuca glaucescens]
MGNSGAKPRASDDGGYARAAPPCLMHPMGNSEAPASSSSSADAAPPCSANLTSSETGEMKPEYPQRPGVADCSYYKSGTCRYGMKCWYNHPPYSSQQASNSSHHNKQQYFSEKACNYNRHEGKFKVKQVKTNFLGLPLRPGAGLCSDYMQQGTCKFGTNCKFHHPDPKSEHANLNASRHVVEESTQLNFSSEPIKRAQNERSVSLVTSSTSGTLETIPTRGDSTCTEHSAYKIVGASKDILELKRDIDVELGHNDSNVQAQPCNRYDGADRRDWLSRGKKEKFNKHGQLISQLDSNAQVYVPWSIQRGNLSDRDGVLMAVKGILDNLMPEKFDLVKDQLIEAGITREDILEDVITVMFEKAVSEPTFCPMYAQLCSYVNMKLPSSPPEEPDVKEIAFTSVLLNNCHEVFEGAGNLCAEIDRLTGLDQETETRNKEIMLMKHRTLGNIRLIGELLKQKIIKDKIVHHTVQMDENKQGKPDWDTFGTKVFCDICTVEVLAGNRPNDHLNAIGYNNLYTKFNEKTKKGYNHKQFKSKWESLKKDYQTWKALLESEDDLGQDPKMNTISTSPEWWAKKMEAMPDCSKFRSAPLENVDLLNIMFEDMLDSSSTTPEANLAVNTTIKSEHGAGDGNDIGLIDKDVNEQSKEAILQKSSNKEPNSTKPKTNSVHAELNHLVDRVENVSPRNSATSTRVDQVESNISEIMELVADAGVQEGSDEHFIATQLFISPEYREMFRTLKTPRGRLGWLKKMCHVKE